MLRLHPSASLVAASYCGEHQWRGGGGGPVRGDVLRQPEESCVETLWGPKLLQGSQGKQQIITGLPKEFTEYYVCSALLV